MTPITKKLKKYRSINKGVVKAIKISSGSTLKLAASIPVILMASSATLSAQCENDIANTQVIPFSGGPANGFDFDVNNADGTGADFRIWDQPLPGSHAVKIKILNPNLEILRTVAFSDNSAYARRVTNTTACESFTSTTVGNDFFVGTANADLFLNVGINGGAGEYAHGLNGGYLIFKHKTTGFLGFLNLEYDWNAPNHTVTMLRGALNGATGCIIPGDCASLTPVPVELIDFSILEKEGDVQLDWVTESEIENAGFEIQRSEDGSNFRSISFVEGNGTTTITKEYAFTDKNVRRGVNYYYRLKQIDFNGSFEYTNVLNIQLKSTETGIGDVYPNPVINGMFNVDFNANETGAWSVSLFSSAGELILSELRTINSGFSTQNFSLSDYPTGIYFIKFENSTERYYKKVTIAE